MFLSRNKKNNVYPCKPQFYCIKVGFKGVNLVYRYVFVREPNRTKILSRSHTYRRQPTNDTKRQIEQTTTCNTHVINHVRASQVAPSSLTSQVELTKYNNNETSPAMGTTRPHKELRTQKTTAL